jgi:hypothetical protein
MSDVEKGKPTVAITAYIGALLEKPDQMLISSDSIALGAESFPARSQT